MADVPGRQRYFDLFDHKKRARAPHRFPKPFYGPSPSSSSYAPPPVPAGPPRMVIEQGKRLALGLNKSNAKLVPSKRDLPDDNSAWRKRFPGAGADKVLDQWIFEDADPDSTPIFWPNPKHFGYTQKVDVKRFVDVEYNIYHPMYGAFARKPISAGEEIGYYHGEKFDEAEYDRKLDLLTPAQRKIHEEYAFTSDFGVVRDPVNFYTHKLDPTYLANPLLRVNEPYAAHQKHNVVAVTTPEGLVRFDAIRNIGIGEQLFMDYGSNYNRNYVTWRDGKPVNQKQGQKSKNNSDTDTE